MKLLGLRLCAHDSNISYFDGNTVRYFKSERKYQIKHHGFRELETWKTEIENLWGVTYKEIDEIAIVLDANTPSSFPSEKIDLFVGKDTYRVDHHYAHALSTWMLTEKSDVQIVMDGCGDEDICWSIFRNGKIVDIGKSRVHGSIAFEMSVLGGKLGIGTCHGLDIAGKVMGLQSYGIECKDFLYRIKDYGVEAAREIFNFQHWVDHKKDFALANLTKLDWAKSVHKHIGDKLVEFFSKYAAEDEVIVYSGGMAQNVIWNTQLKSKFKNLVIPPHCADDGLSLGALEWLRVKNGLPRFKFSNFPYVQSDENPEEVSEETIKHAAKLLNEGKVIAWYQGNGEIGARALGNRSILMDARVKDGKQIVNRVKNREFYRPFGASILSGYESEYFYDLPDNPYMLFVGRVKTDKLPSITHVDSTCRVQTVPPDTSFGRLLTEFYRVSGCPILLNTSLNVAGKPIAGYSEDVLTLFHTGKLDVSIVGNDIKVLNEQ
jgi:carbamoyltransferase